MSYSQPRRRPALGNITTVSTTGLPDFERAAYLLQQEHGVQWGRIGDNAVLDAMLNVMRTLKAVPPGLTSARSGSKLPEDGPFIQGLKALWVRMGRVNEMWPGARGEFNFGPNTNDSKDLRISQALYNLLKAPNHLWRVQGDKFVRLSVNDPLYSQDVRNKLVANGYLDNALPASTKDDSAMVKAIKRWWEEARERRLPVGAWPSGINFGPNTNGDEIRISDELLTNILSGQSPRAVDAAKQAAAGLRAGALRPPLYGSVTTDQPRLAPNTTFLSNMPLITSGMIQITLPKK